MFKVPNSCCRSVKFTLMLLTITWAQMDWNFQRGGGLICFFLYTILTFLPVLIKFRRIFGVNSSQSSLRFSLMNN